jgi:hypothetical protein
MVRPASAPPAVEYTPGGSALPPACANSDSSEGESTEEEDEEELECAGDDYLIAKVGAAYEKHQAHLAAQACQPCVYA